MRSSSSGGDMSFPVPHPAVEILITEKVQNEWRIQMRLLSMMGLLDKVKTVSLIDEILSYTNQGGISYGLK